MHIRHASLLYKNISIKIKTLYKYHNKKLHALPTIPIHIIDLAMSFSCHKN